MGSYIPCYSIRTYSVAFDASDFELLAKAATAIGGQYVQLDIKSKTLTFWHDGARATISGGQARVAEGATTVDKLRVEYSKTVLREAARRFRIDLKPDAKNENQMTLKWRP